MNIYRVPAFLKPFFKSIFLELTRPQYAHLWSLVLAMALNLRSSKLVHLSRLLPFSTHRTRHGAFLASDGFDSPRLLREAVTRLIKRFQPCLGEVIELILDDHRNAKRGKKMDRLNKIWDHAMDGVGAKAIASNMEVQLPSIEQRIESLRKAHRDERIRTLFRKGSLHARYQKKLNTILQAA